MELYNLIIVLTEINGTCPQVKCKACLPGYGYVKDVGGCQTCKCARKSKYSYLDLKFHEWFRRDESFFANTRQMTESIYMACTADRLFNSSLVMLLPTTMQAPSKVPKLIKCPVSISGYKVVPSSFCVHSLKVIFMSVYYIYFAQFWGKICPLRLCSKIGCSNVYIFDTNWYQISQSKHHFSEVTLASHIRNIQITVCHSPVTQKN